MNLNSLSPSVGKVQRLSLAMTEIIVYFFLFSFFNNLIDFGYGLGCRNGHFAVTLCRLVPRLQQTFIYIDVVWRTDCPPRVKIH